MILDTLINTTTVDSQEHPSVAALTNDGFVVTWYSQGQDGSGHGIYAQCYDANGVVRGGEFRINTYTIDNQDHPWITALNDGGFLVSWQSFGQDGDDMGIYAQRYDADGNTQGNEFRINTYTTTSQSKPSSAALNDGGFVASWTSSDGQDGHNSGVYGQRYDANGDTQGVEFKVNTTTNSDQGVPSTATLNDGGFVVIWMSDGQDGSDWGIYGQRYDASGVVQDAEFRVNTYTTSYQNDPSVAALTDGGFVVTWTSEGQDGSLTGIYGQRYNALGIAQGEEFRVNSYTINHQLLPSVTALINGGFVVVWRSDAQDGDGMGIYGQRYDSGGVAQDAEFRINTHTTSDQENPSVTALHDGGFVVTWESWGQDGSLIGIYGKRYDASGNEIEWINHSPTLSAPLVDQAVKYDTLGWSYDISTSFDDVDVSDTLTYGATLINDNPVPAWIQINATTGLISGSPDFDDRGTYALNITATDTHGTSVTAPLTVAATVFDAGKLLISTSGDDTLTGTAGIDTVTYAYATLPVTVSLSTIIQQNTLGAGFDTLSTIDNLMGSNYNDTLTGDGLANVLDGNSGADQLVGGAGNDTYVIDDIGDTIAEANTGGTDLVLTWITLSGLATNVENLTLLGSDNVNANGNKLANILTGNSGNNLLDGKSGKDRMIGGAGDDTYYVDNANDVITENVNEGNDGVKSTVSYTLAANVENLTLMNNLAISGAGNSLANTLTGSAGNNTLTGLTGEDTLFGNAGADILIGGLGVDQLTGGTGADTFRLEITTDSGIDLGNRDIILDFNTLEVDKIDLSLIDAKSETLKKNDAFTWKDIAAFSGAAGELRYFYDGTNNITIVEGTVNADTVADFQIELAGNITLAATNFVL